MVLVGNIFHYPCCSCVKFPGFIGSSQAENIMMQVDLYFSTYRPDQNQEVCDHRGCISMLVGKSVSVKT